MRAALTKHWPEYLMEAAGLATFMVSAGLFTILLFHPDSPVIRAVPDEFVRRLLTGLAMGLTAIGIIYSPWGKQSGAHLNPAVTLTFFRLGKIAPWDAVFYVLAQFIGGAAGVALVAAVAESPLAHPAVNYVVTAPGPGGAPVAFAGEVVISFILMTVVLTVSNTTKLARFTGVCAGVCVALFITFEAPLSGMSMNPARTFGSAVIPQLWHSLWIYFTAPPLGMLLAAWSYGAFGRRAACAKLHHQNSKRCIFCEHQHRRQDAEKPCKDSPRAATSPRMKKLALLSLVYALALPVFAQTKTLLNLDKSGVAIQGHDPVAFFTEGKPVKGSAQFVSRHGGATYRFASKEHKEAFDKEPAKYEPAFGGYCAYGVSKNTLAPIDVEAFQIVEGRLLLQYSKGVRNDFNKDTQGNLTKAQKNWPGLVDKKGK